MTRPAWTGGAFWLASIVFSWHVSCFFDVLN